MNKRNMVARVIADVLDNTVTLPKDPDQLALYTLALNAAKPLTPDVVAMEVAARLALGLQTAKLEGRAPARAPKTEKPASVPYEAVKTSSTQSERISDPVLVATIEPRTGLRSLAVATLRALLVEVSDAIAWHEAHVTPVAGQPAAIPNLDKPATIVSAASTPVPPFIGVNVPAQTGNVPTNDVNPGSFTDNTPGVIVTEPVIVKPAVVKKRAAAARRLATIEAPALHNAKAAVIAALAGSLTPAQQAALASL